MCLRKIKYFKSVIVLTIGLFFVVACTTHKQNFENIMNYDIKTNSPSIQYLIQIYKKRGEYLGMTRVKVNGNIRERYHFKMQGRPKIEPCYYYYEVEPTTKKLIGWGYDNKGGKRSCVY